MSPALVAKRVSTRALLRIPWCMVCRFGSEPCLQFKTQDQSGRKKKMLYVRFGWLWSSPRPVVNVREMQASLCLGLSKGPLDMVIWVFCHLWVQLLSLLWLSQNRASPIIAASSTCGNVKGAAVTACKTKEASGRWGARTLPSHSLCFVPQLVKGSGWVY